MNWIARHRRLALWLICVVWTTAVVLADLFPQLPFLSAIGRGEQIFQDLLRRDGRKTPTRDDFVYIGIDQQSLQLDALSPEEIASNRAFQLMTERPFPWSREVWALLLDRLFDSGARLVMFDMIFNPPNDGDAAFADALNRYHDRVVVGLNFDEQRGTLIGPNSTLIPPPWDQNDRVGLVNFWPDITDGKVRAPQFVIGERQLVRSRPVPGEPVYESLAARGLAKLGHAADVPREMRPHAIRFCPANAYRPKVLWEVFDPKV